MRITFTKSMVEISPRLNASASPSLKQGESFGALLGDISPQKKSNGLLSGDLSVSSPKTAETREPLASVNLNKLGTTNPIPQRLISLESPSPEGVKTPTIVRAERRRIPSPYEGLSLESRSAEVKKLSSAFGYKYGVDPTLATAVAEVESGFNPTAISKDGHESKGLFQLLDTTGKDLLAKTKLSEAYEPYNPEQNAELGISYLRYLHDIFNQESNLTPNRSTIPAADSSSLEKLAVAAFNAGEGRVAQAQKRAAAQGLDGGAYANVEPYLPESTQEYVMKVDGARARYSPQDEVIEGS